MFYRNGILDLHESAPLRQVMEQAAGLNIHGQFTVRRFIQGGVLPPLLKHHLRVDAAAAPQDHPAGADLIPMEQYRQQQFDLLADGVRAALDLPAVYAAMGLAGPKGENA